MTLVRCLSSHVESLTDGSTIAPGEDRNIDVTGSIEQRLLAEGKLVVYDASVITPPDPPPDDPILPFVVQAGNLGTNHTLDFADHPVVWLEGTLDQNLTLLVTGVFAGAQLRLYLTQTGRKTLKITDGATTQRVPVPSAAGARARVTVESPNGSDLVFA